MLSSPLPASFADTRTALHTVAEQVVAPARKPDNEISLRATERGFGTPPFDYEGVSRQVRVEGADLVCIRGEEERRERIRSLAAAAALVSDLLPDGHSVDDVELDVEPDAALALGAWFALGERVLEQLRSEARPDDDATIARLWPEHFDIAIESGSEAEGRRANYGLSPGDEHHDEPYLYVGPWSGDVEGELWNATGFSGAELGYAELAAADDQLAAALDFCRARRDALEPT